MLLGFFTQLRAAKIPVTLREYLTLLEGLDKDLAARSVEDFYYLSRSCLVKDERFLDRFDRVFSSHFKAITKSGDAFEDTDIPKEWLEKLAERHLDPKEREAIKALGWDKLWETLAERLKEQKGRHQGGSKWIGTAGTSPFGAYGYNPEGVRIGQKDGRKQSAVKVWDKREFKNLVSTVELGTRNIKVALRRLRKFAREGAQDELALDDTIRATANNAGWLDIKMQAERKNKVKVLMLMDVGGTMDDHIARVEELFSAAKTEFKNMEFFYFHNCLYETLWKNNRRRHAERFASWDVLRKYPPDTKIIFVGDATMSPYEIVQPGGSVEYHNEEAGAVWLQRFAQQFPKYVWLNPEPEQLWQYRQSIAIIRQLMSDRMYPITMDGLERAMQMLSK